MKTLLEPAAICLAMLWCLAATCTPEPPAASPIAVPALIPEAAAPAPNDDGVGDLSQSKVAYESPETPKEITPKLSDLPPMQAELPAAPEPARGSGAVETYAAMQPVNPGSFRVEPKAPAGAAVAPYTANCANGNCAPTIRQSRTVAPVYRQPAYYQPRRRIGWRFGR
jgi:hypothetical protein